MTPEEKHLWYDFVKRLPFVVKRQKSIANYIVDFYIRRVKMVIEIDGLQHLEPQHLKNDETRDLTLNSMGISVVRYSNDDVNNRFTAVENDISHRLGLNPDDLNDE
jgi:very-short-patch-repair endonuclease